MKSITLLILLSLSTHTFATKLDELISKEQAVTGKEPKSSSQISIESQNKVFTEANLLKEVSNFDQVDRDMLILIAKKENLEVLAKKFPDIPPEKLKVLKTLVDEKK